MAVPTFKVEIGWTSAQAGLLVFGFSDYKTPVTYTVTNKALTSNVATLTAPGHTVKAGDTISVTGVDATFNTTGVSVTSVTSTTILYPKTAANVTSVASSGSVGQVSTTDVFGNAFSSFFNGPNDDVTSDVVSVRIKRGRDDILSQINGGTADIDFCRPSERPYWNPANKSSTINTNNVPGFVPMRPVRITATDPATSTSYGLFYGFIRSAKFDYATGVCSLSCVDLFIQMSRLNPLDPAYSSTNGGSSSSASYFVPDLATASDVTSASVTSSSRTGLAKLA